MRDHLISSYSTRSDVFLSALQLDEIPGEDTGEKGHADILTL
jgi:hypothetical protein